MLSPGRSKQETDAQRWAPLPVIPRRFLGRFAGNALDMISDNVRGVGVHECQADRALRCGNEYLACDDQHCCSTLSPSAAP